MIHESHVRDILEDVATERTRQDTKWEEQNHDPRLWISILAEEFGEAAMGANKLTWGGETVERIFQYRLELIETAAVAVAAIESLDRNSFLTLDQADELECRFRQWRQQIRDNFRATRGAGRAR